MRLTALTAAFVAAGSLLTSRAGAQVPRANHIIVVIMENHSYDEVRTETFTSSLISDYSTCTASYGIGHPSQPNYIALWAGSTLGVGDDTCPPAGAPFNDENLGHACEAAGLSWRAYSEDLPEAGSTTCSSGGYRRKHAPWTNFSNLDHANERPYSDLAADIAAGNLPALAFVVPNNCDNTHDCSVTTGDAWLSANLPAMIGALGPHGMLILTWDEDDNTGGNHVLTMFMGPIVKPGYASTSPVNHYSVVRTICDALGIGAFGDAATAAAVTDIWREPNGVKMATWGSVKALYR